MLPGTFRLLLLPLAQSQKIFQGKGVATLQYHQEILELHFGEHLLRPQSHQVDLPKDLPSHQEHPHIDLEVPPQTHMACLKLGAHKDNVATTDDHQRILQSTRK
jgi:hypothetical protein